MGQLDPVRRKSSRTGFSFDFDAVGEMVRPNASTVVLHIRVRAAPWINVGRVTLYQAGKIVAHWPVTRSSEIVRFETTFSAAVRGDDFFVLRADGDEPLPIVAGDTDKFRVLPFALSNPIFVDANGDGRFR